MSQYLKDEIWELKSELNCAKGKNEALAMILQQLLNVLKQTNPQQYEAIKKETNDRKEYMAVVLGEIGESHIEQYAEGYVEMCDEVFYDETEHFTKEQLAKMKAPYA